MTALEPQPMAEEIEAAVAWWTDWLRRLAPAESDLSPFTDSLRRQLQVDARFNEEGYREMVQRNRNYFRPPLRMEVGAGWRLEGPVARAWFRLDQALRVALRLQDAPEPTEMLIWPGAVQVGLFPHRENIYVQGGSS